MAGFIQGITIEFGANTEKLNKGLGKLQGRLNKTQAELKQIDRMLRFNPGNTTLLSQKFKLLSANVTQTEKKLQALRAMQKRMDSSGVDKTSAQYRQLEREIVKTESQLKQAQNALKQFGSIGKQQALAVGNAFKTAGNKIKSAGRTITTSFSVYGAAGIYAGSKLIDMSEAQTQAENKLTEIYKSRMGVGKQAVKSTLALATAQQKAGVVGDEVQFAGAQQLATYAKYPSTVNTMLPALNNLLVQQKGLNGTQEDATALANLFGKAMMGQTGALKRAGISFTAAQEEVLKYGTEEEKAAMIAEVVQQNVGNMNAEFAKTDAGKIQQAKNTIGDMGEEIGAVLLPAVADLASWISENLLPKIQTLIEWFQQHPKIATFALALAGITAVLGPVIMVIGGLVSAIGTIITAVTTIGPIIAGLAGPIGIVVASIAAAIAIGVLLYKNWDTIKAKAIAVWNAIKTAIMKPVNTIKNTVKTNFNTLKTNVTSVFTSIKTKATSVWNGIKDAIINPIKKAKDKVVGIINTIKSKFPFKLGKIINFKIPKIGLKTSSKKVLGRTITYPSGFNVSWNKKAMNNPYMFSNATLFGAGEAGDEILYGRNALLNDIANASGIDYTMMANALVSALSEADGNISLYIDGKQMAQAQAPYMNVAINQLQSRQARTLGFVGV